MSQRTRTNLLRAVVLVLVVGLTVVLYLNRARVQNLGVYGYPGLFLITLLSNATIILPVPGVAFTAVFGTIFNPWFVALVAGTGAALGELTGYLAGFSGQAVIENQPQYERVTGWMNKYGDWVILVLAFIPNPLFDVAGMASGALRVPIYRFLLLCWIGKVGKMALFAFFGSALPGWFSALG